MQVGGAGGQMSAINVTPLVDVVLVLLIIFMVMTPVVQMGYLVRVPPKAPPGLPTDVMSDQIVISFSPDHRARINKEEVPLESFPQRLREVLKGNTSKMIFFSGDPTVSYDDTMKFLDLARSSGANNIGIIVEEVPK
jgi:biopolymer transport protein TolR